MPLARHASALEPASDLWTEIKAGKFEIAVQRLQLHVAEWPLDRDARSDLAIMQFAAGEFAKSEENLARIIKLQRGFASGGNRLLDMEYLEAWYRLAQLRAGHALDTPSPISPNSLLAVLARSVEPEAFAASWADAVLDFNKGLEAALGNTTQTTQVDGMTVTMTTKVAHPAREPLEREYLCLSRFMLGEQALGQDDLSTARKQLAEAVVTKSEHLIEYHIAKAELAQIG
jgi:hypothetical protein